MKKPLKKKTWIYDLFALKWSKSIPHTTRCIWNPKFEKSLFLVFQAEVSDYQAAMGNAPAACCKCEEDGWIHVGHVGRFLVSVVSIARDSVCVLWFLEQWGWGIYNNDMIYMKMNHGTFFLDFTTLTAWQLEMIWCLKSWKFIPSKPDSTHLPWSWNPKQKVTRGKWR